MAQNQMDTGVMKWLTIIIINTLYVTGFPETEATTETPESASDRGDMTQELTSLRNMIYSNTMAHNYSEF